MLPRRARSRPHVTRGNWSAAEDRLLAQGHAVWGASWSRIARVLNTRTENQVGLHVTVTVTDTISGLRRAKGTIGTMTSYGLTWAVRGVAGGRDVGTERKGPGPQHRRACGASTTISDTMSGHAGACTLRHLLGAYPAKPVPKPVPAPQIKNRFSTLVRSLNKVG